MSEQFQFIQQPEVVGYFDINPMLAYEMTHKPNWWYRFWARKLLGWKWRDV